MNLVSLVLPPIAAEPAAREALVFHDTGTPLRVVLTHAQAREMVGRWAALFAARVRPGERVVLSLPHGLDLALAWLGAISAGAVAVPLSPQLHRTERDWILRDAAAALHLRGDDVQSTGPDLPELGHREAAALLQLHEAQAPLPMDDDAPAYQVYTSGSAGQPKGVLHAHRSIRARTWMDRHWSGMREGDRIVHAGELNWTYTLGLCLLDALRLGATAILVDRGVTPDAWGALIEEEKATLFAAVPSLYRRIARHAGFAPFARLRHGLCAGEPLPAALHERWCRETGRPLFEALGMSECSTYLSSGPTTPSRPASPGRIQSGRRIVLLPPEGGTQPVDAGEEGVLAIHRSDPGLMLGYWPPDADDPDSWRGEWFLTGDLAREEADGYLRYIGRMDSLLNVSGYRVSPEELERTLRTHPDIEDAIVGLEQVRDDLQLLAALVVPCSEGLDSDALAAWAAERIAAWKCPRRWHLVSELPRTARGKRDRRGAFRNFPNASGDVPS